MKIDGNICIIYMWGSNYVRLSRKHGNIRDISHLWWNLHTVTKNIYSSTRIVFRWEFWNLEEMSLEQLQCRDIKSKVYMAFSDFFANSEAFASEFIEKCFLVNICMMMSI